MTRYQRQRPLVAEEKQCPLCGEGHIFNVIAIVTTNEIEAPLIFAGPAPLHTYPLMVACPVTHRPLAIDVAVPLRDGETLDTVTTGGASEGAPMTTAPNNKMTARETDTSEYSEWLRQSLGSGRDYAKTMIGASTAAIGGLFALTEYLGIKAASSGWAALGIVAAVSFLIGAGFFALALQPRLRAVGPEQFELFRKQRLERLNRHTRAGLVCFQLGTSCATLLAAILWWPQR